MMWLGLIALARADSVAELAKIHLEVMGGKERIDALTSMRATGRVVAGGQQVTFTFIAARPNRLRLETIMEGRTLVQVSDGVQPPWKFDTAATPLRAVDMPEKEAEFFAVDAEFDDPLVAGEARGYSFDFAGEVKASDKRYYVRILVTRKLVDTFALLVDPETYLIVARIEERKTAGGRRVQVVTRFDDYRPVNGVPIPYKITLVAEGKAIRQTTVESVEANPKITDQTFARPALEVPALK